MDRNERGDIIVGWLTKVAIVIVLVAIPLFDLVSVAVGRVNGTDTATNAAIAGSEVYRTSKGDVQKAYQAAVGYAGDHGATIAPEKFVVATDGTVTVTVERDVTTLVFYRIGASKKWTHIVATGSGKSL